MPDTLPQPDSPPRPSRSEWLARLTEIGRGHGFFDRIGARHSALHVHEGDTLLVTFDEADRVRNRSADALPLGFEQVRKREWSLLSILCSGKTWFRDPDLYAFFDRLIDEDFFEDFDQVIFLGAGQMCGYAAAAFSVASPGARVVAISPVATLDRESAPFEMRFSRAWRLNFTERYGFAPDMLDGAQQAFVIYDPLETLDAAHAALFRGGAITRLRMRGAGRTILPLLETQGTLDRILKATAKGRMSPRRFAQITRKLRRNHPGYLRGLLARAEERGHWRLAAAVARHGHAVTGERVFARHLAALDRGPDQT